MPQKGCSESFINRLNNDQNPKQARLRPMDDKFTLIKFLDSSISRKTEAIGKEALPAVSSTLRSVLVGGSSVTGSNSLMKMGFRNIDQVNEFSDKVEELVQSKDFLEHLSIKVGEPRLSETEDDFVVRAKEELKYLLRIKLDKKP